jgi:hypothetical protein
MALVGPLDDKTDVAQTESPHASPTSDDSAQDCPKQQTIKAQMQMDWSACQDMQLMSPDHPRHR